MTKSDRNAKPGKQCASMPGLPVRAALGMALVLGASGRLVARADPADESAKAAPLTEAYRIVDEPDERVAVLSNGLTVIAKSHRTAPVVSARVYCKTGSIYEQEYLGSGMSHLFEHLLHGGATPTRSEEEAELLLDQIGSNSNAYTSFGRTAYFINTAKENAATAVELLADQMTHPTFPQKAFDREWGVVQRELERDLDNADRQLFYLMLETMYQRHPARFPIIGHKKIVQTLTKDAIVEYYYRMYVPDNVVVSIAGDLDMDEMFRLASDAFAGFARRPLPTISLPEEPDMATPRHAVKRMKSVQAAILRLCWPSIKLTHPDLYALDVLSYVMTEGESSRLYRALVRDTQLCFAIDSMSWTPDWGRGIFAVTARLAPPNVDKARAAIREQIKRLQNELISQKELDQAKRQKAAEHVFAHQTAESVAESMAIDFMTTGDPHFSDAYVANIQKVTAEQIRQMARRYLVPEKMATILVLPEGAPLPGGEVASASAASPIKKIVLDNGLRCLLRRDTASPMVAMRLYFIGGVLTEDESNNGIANVTAELATRGTESHSAEEISRFFDSRGGSFSASSGYNTLFFQAQVLTDDFPEAFEWFADAILHPTFPEAELEKIRPIVLDRIDRIDEHWRSELSAYFRSRFFSVSPYRMLPVGRKASVAGLDRDKIEAYYRNQAVGPNGVLAIFGDIDLAAAEKMVRELFGALPGGGGTSVRPQVLAEKPVTGPVLYIKKKPDSRRVAGIQLGFSGIRFTNQEDYFPLAVLDSIMSGYYYPGGWLHDALRGGDRSLVYEVHAMNIVGIEPGCFTAYAACEPAKVGEVYKILAEKFDKARAGDFNEDELARAKGIILTAELMHSQTNAQRGSQAALDELYGLGYDRRKRLAKLVNGVTIDDVRRVAKKYLTSPIITVVTPNPEAVKIGIEPTAIDQKRCQEPFCGKKGS